jgi:type VI secretion system protein ImpC
MPEANGEKKADAAEAKAIEPSEFDSLLQKEFKPKSDGAKAAVEKAVTTLAQQALAETALVSDDAIKTIEGVIAEIDRKLTEQINLIMHHDAFAKLEGSWRGLAHLVNNTETDEMLQIRVFNISKKDLGKNLKKFKGSSWDQSPIFKKIYEEEYGTPGGAPYGCLIGDYEFDHGPQDVEVMGGMAQIAAASHSPFIAAAGPSLMNMDSWQQLSDPRDLSKLFTTAEYAPWRSLRETEDSKYLALAMPRFLSRLPYDPEKNPVDEFDFVEDTAGAAHERFIWSNSAFAMGTNRGAARPHLPDRRRRR